LEPERCDDAHVRDADPERIGERLARIAEDLQRHVDGELRAVPLGFRCMRLHRCSVLGGRVILRLKLDVRCGEIGLEIAGVAVGIVAAVEAFGHFRFGLPGARQF
jgi:hypothetical protein